MEHDIVCNTLLIIGIMLGPLCLLGIMLWLTLNALSALARWLLRVYQLETTPCGHCLYYTRCPELACAVNPCSALTKAARNCKDFSPGEVAKIIMNRQSKLTH